MQSSKLNHKRGFGLVEVLVGLTVLSVSFFAMLSISRAILTTSRATSDIVMANFLLEEGVEAMRSIRDRGWTANISSLSGTKYLSFSTATSSPKWNIGNTPEVIDSKFYRSIAVSTVNRDSTSKDIVTTGGSVDANTKKFTITVSWMGISGTSTRSMSTYFTNYFND